MRNEHSTERLDYTSAQQQEEKPHYTPRPKFHRVMAWWPGLSGGCGAVRVFGNVLLADVREVLRW